MFYRPETKKKKVTRCVGFEEAEEPYPYESGPGRRYYHHKKGNRNQAPKVTEPVIDDGYIPPCYFPQIIDELPVKEHLEPMGPIGPWATGKVDWSPVAGITGIRPVVNCYTVTRFSPCEWRAHNYDTVKTAYDLFIRAQEDGDKSSKLLVDTSKFVENTQKNTTKNIRRRFKFISHWKDNLGKAVKAMANEISSLEEMRVRLKKSLVILGVPESIARECIEKRCGRPDTELISDAPQDELVNELSLIAEIRETLKTTMENFEQQQVENRIARQRLERDWSDKKESHEMDGLNMKLNNNNMTIMYRPGAIRSSPWQASEEYWDHFSKETFDECEDVRKKSAGLRATLEAVYQKAATDLRAQANLVEKVFKETIACNIESIKRFEVELKECLRKIARIEIHIANMNSAVRSYNASFKVVQTRMFNRSFRPNVENCRDEAQLNLINEIDVIGDSVGSIMNEIDQAENLKQDLMAQRCFLEREIMLKRRVLFIDQVRCMRLRAKYPTAEALTGRSNF